MNWLRAMYRTCRSSSRAFGLDLIGAGLVTQESSVGPRKKHPQMQGGNG